MDERYYLLAEAVLRNINTQQAAAGGPIELLRPVSPEEEARIPKKLPSIVLS